MRFNKIQKNRGKMKTVSDFPVGALVKTLRPLDDIEVGTTGIVLQPSWECASYVRVLVAGRENLSFERSTALFRPDELMLIPVSSDSLLPSDATERKKIPVAGGVMDYFPSALIEVAKVSQTGNDQHNPGQPLHWARGKSKDQADTMLRHFLERGKLDSDGIRHSAKMVWRALAILQLELEAEGAPIARGAKE
jgi:hypothetical protein